jgi:hypothetical protein
MLLLIDKKKSYNKIGDEGVSQLGTGISHL